MKKSLLFLMLVAMCVGAQAAAPEQNPWVILGLNKAEILALDESEQKSVINKVYAKLALTCHPDKTTSFSREERKNAEEEFKKLGAAVEAVRKDLEQAAHPEIKPQNLQEVQACIDALFNEINEFISTPRSSIMPDEDLSGLQDHLREIRQLQFAIRTEEKKHSEERKSLQCRTDISGWRNMEYEPAQNRARDQELEYLRASIRLDQHFNALQNTYALDLANIEQLRDQVINREMPLATQRTSFWFRGWLEWLKGNASTGLELAQLDTQKLEKLAAQQRLKDDYEAERARLNTFYHQKIVPAILNQSLQHLDFLQKCKDELHADFARNEELAKFKQEQDDVFAEIQNGGWQDTPVHINQQRQLGEYKMKEHKDYGNELLAKYETHEFDASGNLVPIDFTQRQRILDASFAQVEQAHRRAAPRARLMAGLAASLAIAAKLLQK
jgi:hypothetical protein